MLFQGSLALAQQEAMYTHYMYNLMAVNPAYTGYENQLSATLIHRSQWLSIPGAPVFQTFSIQSPTSKNVGIGFSFVNDRVGPERNIALKAYYSYTIRSEEKLKISFGLKGGLNMLQIGLTDITLDNPDDPAFKNNIESTYLPNFGFGVFAYTDHYYFGISVPDLIQHDYLNNTIFSSSDLSLQSNKYYLLVGATYALSERILIKPSGFVSLSKSKEEHKTLDVEADLSSLFVIDNRFAGGLMFRSKGAIAFLVGIMLTQELEFGYSFDMLISNKKAIYNGGGHEVILKYNFKNKNKKRKDITACSAFQ